MRAQHSAIFCLAAAFAAPAFAFDSGSSGADGAFAPNVDTEVTLPPSGILNYASINIPTGVTVRFKRNALNTPATLLVSGNATIAGTINVSGAAAADSNGAGNGNVADDTLPGAGGPGGFAGGNGAKFDVSADLRFGQAGLGPGGGKPPTRDDLWYCSGGNGSFGSKGDSSACTSNQSDIYGNPDLLPLVGGSGGAGGIAFINSGGGGGGGGGGALLIAVTGTLQVTGSILSNGGRGGNVGNGYNNEGGAPGGAGSGGAIRLVATTLSGNGTINAVGGHNGTWGNNDQGSNAGVGRIRLEAETYQRTSPTNPAFSQGTPGALVITGVPTIRIASVAGQNAPAEPTGNGDIVLPANAPNPVSVGLATTNVPLGTTISVIVTPPHGQTATSISTGLAGTEAAATATANVSLPDGPSVLLATLSFTVAGAQQFAYARYTGGEAVAQVETSVDMSGAHHTTFTTVSGRKVTL